MKKTGTKSKIFSCADSDEHRYNATCLIRGEMPRDPESLAARLARQFIDLNKGILGNFDINLTQDYDGSNIWLVFKTGIKVGALPLLSPTSGKPDYGMVIRPRFEWSGIGAMLAQMGWRVVPHFLRLPLLPGTERNVPPWVLSSVILIRVKTLLDQLERRFELIKSNQPAPKGTVNWPLYATQQLPVAKFLEIPCQFPDLRDDRSLKSAIHYTLRKQLASLESQRNFATVVIALLDLCQSLLKRVVDVPPQKPSPTVLQNWFSGPLKHDTFRDGIQAIEWTIDNRGLAGIANLQGLPWVLPMDAFFEAWIETLAFRLAKLSGGTLRIGRKRETLASIHWDNSYTGTQRYLLPDIILERDDTTYIIDAKYKYHWHEITEGKWNQSSQEIHEQHRQDLLQILAYSSLKSSPRVVACLVYPCQIKTWESLKQRRQLVQHATLAADGRNIEIVLTAVPMNANVEEVITSLREIFIPMNY